MDRVMVMGGYSTLGQKMCELLLTLGYTIIIAGKKFDQSQRLAKSLSQICKRTDIEALALDEASVNLTSKLQAACVKMVIHAGPFHHKDFRLPMACIDAGVHYLDIAQDTEYVFEMTALSDKAKENRVVVISGAGLLPGLSSVIVDNFSSAFSVLREVVIGYVPSHDLAQTKDACASLMIQVGKPYERLEKGQWVTAYGLQEKRALYYGDNLGLRWHGNVEVPDLALLPKRYPTLETMTYFVGIDLGVVHFMLRRMSWLVRVKLLQNVMRFSQWISWLSQKHKPSGSDKTGMLVRLYGTNHDIQPLEMVWTLIAERDASFYLPCLSCVLVAQKILLGHYEPGAMTAMGLFTLAEFDTFIKPWGGYTRVDSTVM